MNLTDILNPWKDIAAYNINDAYRFKGRESDIEKFLKIINSGTASVLYANSGIGKTSFINAGILPSMLANGYYPIHILFLDEVLQKEKIEDWLYQEIWEGLNYRKVDTGIGGTYHWKPFILAEHPVFTHSLWWLLNTHIIQETSTKKTYKPLIIFDQFEEVFTKSNKEKKTNILNSLFELICDLCSTSMPKSIENALEELDSAGKYIEIDNIRQYKLLFSLRKEFLSDFDYWTNDRYSVTELHQNRMFLLPLTRNQAEQVIAQQPISIDDSHIVETLIPIKDLIISLIDDKKKDEVEPFILSILCSNLFRKAQANNKNKLTADDIEFNSETIAVH